MNNPYYFIDENIKVGFKTNIESHKINHANSLYILFLTFQTSDLKQDMLIKS